MKRLASYLGAAAAITIAAGCGNASSTTIKGEVGLTRAANDHVIALVATCDAPVTLVDVNGSREGLKEDQVNPELGQYVAAKPASGVIRLDLEAPNQGWTASKLFDATKVPTASVIIAGFNRDSDSQTASTAATRNQIKALKQGQVLRSDGSTVSESSFTDKVCSS